MKLPWILLLAGVSASPAAEVPSRPCHKPVIPVYGVVVSAKNSTLMVSNSVMKPVVTERSCTHGKALVPHYIRLNGYPHARKVKIGDRIDTQGVIISTEGGTRLVQWVEKKPDAENAAKKVWR